MADKSKEKRRIYIVVVVFLVLLLGIVILRIQRQKGLSMEKGNEDKKEEVTVTVLPTKAVQPGKYSIELSKNEVDIGESIEANVKFFANGKKLDGSDVILKFDPSLILADSIKTGDYFNNYPIKSIDNTKGIIKVSGYMGQADADTNMEVTMFTFFLTGKSLGTSVVSFDFEEGQTNKTTLVEHQTSQNILGSARNTDLTIK